MSYESVIFDNDGVLTHRSDPDVIYQAVEQTFTEFGVADPPNRHVRRLFGVTLEDLMVVCTAHDLDPASFWNRRDQNVAAAQIDLLHDGEKGLYDDADLLRTLPDPVGIVSNNQHETVKSVVDHYGLASHVDVAYGRQPTLTDLRRKKPAPYYLNQAITDLGVDRSSVLYVGDSVTDILAARRAGVDSAFVRRSHRHDVELPVPPTIEVSSLTELPVSS